MAVYFVRDTATGQIKIGYASKPWGRFSKIQTDTPAQLEMAAVIEGDLDVERELHVRFAHARLRGEWFRPSADLTAYLAVLPPPERAPRRGFVTTGSWNGKRSQEVAELTGISKQLICEIRKGKRRPSPENALKIQRACGVSAIKLVFGELAEEAA